MASSTGNLGMFPSQLEGDIAMVKIMTVAINPIMACQAVLSISLKMGLHEISLDLLVASSADSLVEC
jgi:hypothetical protein